jgi:hypothetical protein
VKTGTKVYVVFFAAFLILFVADLSMLADYIRRSGPVEAVMDFPEGAIMALALGAAFLAGVCVYCGAMACYYEYVRRN